MRTALAVAAVLVAGCGGSNKDGSAAQAPRPVDAEKTVDAFLYAPPAPANVCPRLWVASAQPDCAHALRKLKQARARHVFAPPKRGAMMYRLAGVEGDRVSIEAGDRQPDPSKGPPSFYGIFELRRVGSAWKVVREEP